MENIGKLPSKVHYLIIGAGVTGLSCAAELVQKNYLVLERESDAGGYCRTFKIGDFVWDYAGHFFHFNNDNIKRNFESLLSGKEIVFNKKNTKVWYMGKLIDAPFQYNIHQLEKDDFIDCLVGMFEQTTDRGVNFYEMLYSKYGKPISERFLIPYNEKLYACDLNNLDRNAMGRFFPSADRNDIVKGFRGDKKKTYNDSFYYSREGAVSFVKEILNKIPKEKIRYNVEVESIDIESKCVMTNHGRLYYDVLINTMPFNIFLKKMDINASVHFTANQVLVFNLGFDKAPNDKTVHWIYIPDPNICFYRVGFYNNILNMESMSLYVELGFAEDEKIDVEIYRNRVLTDLKKIGIIDTHKLVASNDVLMSPAYVHISTECIKEKDRIKEKIKQNDIYTIGRYGDWCYCSIEDCIIQAKNLVDSLLNND